MEKYFAIFTLSFKRSLKNYKALIGLSIFLMTCLLIFANLWKIVAAKTGMVVLNPDQLLWYIAFNEWVLISIPDVQDDIEQDFRSGRLAYQLPRPVSYLGSIFAESFGVLTVNLMVLGGVTFMFSWLQVGTLPFHPIGLAVSIIFGFMSGILGIIFLMLIGLSSFWLHDVAPFYWIWEKLLFMFGGLILPLVVYPQWMQIFAKFTPFPSILGARSALALDFDIAHIIILATSIISWSVLGLFCLILFYRKSLLVLNIEGG
jgi:ABC-2 type transport system permease protein